MDETETNDDFTFCQVNEPNKNAPKSLPDVSSMSIKDENNGSTIWGDNLKNNEKEEKVGPLTFKDAASSSQKKSTEFSKKDVGNSVSSSKNSVKIPVYHPRVPCPIGHSHMDWHKLTHTHPDLAGLKGQSNKRLIPLSEVKQHNTEDSLWTILKGRVYNIAPYMKYHPGGIDMLMKAVGKDCTALFNKYHAYVNAEFMLEKCLVGILEETRK